LKIIFSEDFEATTGKYFGITRKDVIRAVTNPLKKQSVDIGGLNVLFFLQKDRKSNTYMIVLGQKKENTLTVNRGCFRILPELASKIGSNEPIDLLQQLANSFGLPITVNNQTVKFLFRESFIGPPNAKIAPFGKIPVKPGDHIFGSPFFKSTLINKTTALFQFAIVFFLELNSYLGWLNGKENLQTSPQAYDLFIAYKHSTGKTPAKRLKESLTEEGYRVFLDKPSIPEEFEIDDKWFAVRDEAIKNSRRFLLVLTIAIQSSDEVAKEYYLARQVPKMKFIYARHDMLKPDIQLSYANEVFDLADGNQLEFDTDDDLTRKVLKILMDDERNLPT
jgi:hypothetical protein